MIDAFKIFLRNYTNFDGRSTRADYWWVVLCNAIIGFVLGFVGGLLGQDATKLISILVLVYELAIIVPCIALMVRRLHDINKSGWYIFMGLIPLAGPIILLIYWLTPSVAEGNNYGPRAE